MFYVSQLRKYVYGSTHIVVHESLELKASSITYEEQPMKIVDSTIKQLRNKTIPLVKVI